MSTITQPQSPARAPARADRVVLQSIDWTTYVALRDNPANWRVRMTYDRGVLELMSPLRMHDARGRFIGRLIGEWTMELDITLASCGSTTLRREDLDRGCEPDEGFYIENEPLMRPHESLDLAVHPPPDLVVEVDVTSDSLGRMPIYRALGVPEVWRHDGERLRFYALGEDGDYAEIAVSRQLPPLRPADIERFLDLRSEVGENDAVRAFREWIRAAVLPQHQEKQDGTAS